ncbi:hypothetical protein TAMA11512_16940 [Selenomonas sp. TAMA-11512]|uniref:hypothetical protein n=1 Tax=Selenomonas sp. TAMA-11512 TaxID=3095337 RepID=UPI00308A9882|nr:hypothetical protein TAMA11512_16940 [Selenomonas sp. TAMA-11512]
MKHRSLKKMLGATLTALAALALTAAPAAAKPAALAPDAEAQLDVMASSGVIAKELNALYRTWDFILNNGSEERTHYVFYAAVTDLDRNGRLELLISRHFLNNDLLYYASDDVSEEQWDGLKYLCENYPGEIYGAAYEISADKTSLEPLEINSGEEFPDFTRLHIKGRKTDGHLIYYVDTQRMPRDESRTSATDRYDIIHEAQTIWLDAGVMGSGTLARSEGTAGVHGDKVEPFYTSMKLIGTDKDIDPYGKEADKFRRKYMDGGRRVSFTAWNELEQDTRAALASSWQGWSYEK